MPDPNTSSYTLHPPEDFSTNPFAMIGEEWMLVTAGTIESWNTMTASWGGMGVLWNRNVTFAFVRPTRHTYGFTEEAPLYTLSFFGPGYRDELTLCGTRSGRDTDKAKETGLVPFEAALGAVSFRQARVILVCRKLYFGDIHPANFLDPGIAAHYPLEDYHRFYVGEIEQLLVRDDG